MSKQHLGRLAIIMAAKGIRQVVVSPGSRNAPAIIIFGKNKDLELISVTDERSAGFFALGLAMASMKPVALLCTSGSAVLNYAPAISEAYYQKIPLLILTADRPAELIDQGDSQTIRQNNIFANYIRKSLNAPVSIRSKNEEWYFDRIVNEAIDRTRYPAPGPVHLNIPLDEPLYDLKFEKHSYQIKLINHNQGIKRFAENTIRDIAARWQKASSKMIIVGQMPPEQSIQQQLIELAADPSVIILSECTSNQPCSAFVNCIDRTLAQIPHEKNMEFAPEILLSLGGAIVSKKIKALLRDMHPKQHWHIDPDPDSFHFDTYKSLTSTFDVDADVFLQQLLLATRPSVTVMPVGYQVPGSGSDETQLRTKKKPIGYNSDTVAVNNYSEKWKDADKASQIQHNEFLNNIKFCDLKAYSILFGKIPLNSAVHLANSTPVRYGQLFNQRPDLTFYSNRGTSGIDGCTSTAAGFAYNHKGLTFIITGDIAFFYDSNALWNNYLPGSFRIILINNGGGNIFRIIDGPSDHEELEPFIETRHHLTAKGIATNFNIEYYSASNEDELTKQLTQLVGEQQSGRPAMLEITTDNILSAKTLKDYFGFLRKNIEKFES